MKTWAKRALRTFIQSFAGTFSAGLVASVSGVTDMNTLKVSLMSLGASAVAAGIAAAMNINADQELKNPKHILDFNKRLQSLQAEKEKEAEKKKYNNLLIQEKQLKDEIAVADKAGVSTEEKKVELRNLQEKIAKKEKSLGIEFEEVSPSMTKEKAFSMASEYDAQEKLLRSQIKALESKVESAQELINNLTARGFNSAKGEAEVRKLFKFSKVGTIAGSYVTSGVIKRGAKARVIRDGVVVNDSIIATLAREKDQAKEVKQGLECGITIENFNDIKEKDVIEAYELKEVRKQVKYGKRIQF